MRAGLEIDWLDHPAFPGRIGLSRCPGAGSGSLQGDLGRIRATGATALVCLMERDERGRDLGRAAALAEQAGLVWYHLPIIDFGVPDEAFEGPWAEVAAELLARLRRGEAIVIHCYGGLGRTGMVAARLLVEVGEPPHRAMRLVRDVRPGAVQNAEQERWVLGLRPG